MGAHRNRRSACLSTLALLVLALGSIAMSMAVAALAPGLRGHAGGPAIEAVAGGPNATPARSDVRLLALRGSGGADDFDVHVSDFRPHRLADSGGGSPARRVTADLHPHSDSPAHQGRAPPHALSS